MFEVYDVLKTFSDSSANWDKKNEYISSKTGETRRLHRILQELVTCGIKILDIGSGTGKIVRFLLELKRDAEIVAADIALNMSLNSILSNNKVCCFITDVQNLCFKKETFDLIILQQVLHHIPNPTLAMKEIFRILKPKGFVVLLTVGHCYQSNLFQVIKENMLEDALGRTNSYYLRQLMVQSGLNVLTTVDDYFSMSFANFEQYYNFLSAVGSLHKIFKYKPPPNNAKQLLCEMLFKSVVPPDNEIAVDGHYITVLARK